MSTPRVPHARLRPDDDHDDDPCPSCLKDDRILYDDEHDEWCCTRCATHWPVEPFDPRRPRSGDEP